MVHPGPELAQPLIFFLRFLLRIFCPKFSFSKFSKVQKKYFMNINSFLHLLVGPEMVQGGPVWSNLEFRVGVLVQVGPFLYKPRVSIEKEGVLKKLHPSSKGTSFLWDTKINLKMLPKGALLIFKNW